MAKTVLVVDDDQDFLELLDAVLTPEGYNVACCLNPVEAYEEAQKIRPDVVIVDLRMPGQNGLQLIECLKSDPLIADIHCIVCTAAVSDAMLHVASIRQWGCDVLIKPFELDDLLALLAKAKSDR